MKKQMKFMVTAILLGLFACNDQSAEKNSISIDSVFYNTDNIIVNTRKGITYINRLIANGYIIQLNQHKDTLLKDGYINGKKHGICYLKYPNMQYQYIRHFINGKTEGTQLSWWENGNIKQEAHYKDDVFHGKLKEWNFNGMLSRDNNYVLGHEEGKQKMWYDNGKLRANYVVKDGRIYGLSGTMNCMNAAKENK